ncbi:MAG: hypothetical protein PHW24_01115 [Candidatus Moranbacteria bacterium]|jgi:hypothetical protein|nr:hypothetical protein [Candidatus Moranbacteria bacterium]
MRQRLEKGKSSGTIFFDIVEPLYEPGNSRLLFIQAIRLAIADRPVPMPDPAKFIFEEHSVPEVTGCIKNYAGAKIKLSWEKEGDDIYLSGKILLGEYILASFLPKEG